MAMAGHRSYATTKRHVDLAGVVFEDAQERLRPVAWAVLLKPDKRERGGQKEAVVRGRFRPSLGRSLAKSKNPKSANTGQVVEVEPGEAEFLLDVLEGAFDFWFVQPARAEAQRAAVNAKLREAGKSELEESP
jgi:hypothetical protein